MKLALLLLSGSALASAQELPLSALDLTRMRQGFGSPQIDRSVEGRPLRIGGRSFGSGVGSHADSILRVELDGQARRFTAWVGVDDETAGRGSVRFRVIVDHELAFDSGVLRGGEPAQRVDLALSGARSLLLLSDHGGDDIDYDHADWAEAGFEVGGEAPRAVAAMPEAKPIRTPPPGKKPLLNGPLVQGARPGRPFLYRIPATGERPMTFAALGLPASLKLDAGTGLLTGRVPKEASEYPVLLRAENGSGSSERELTIVVGETLALTPPMGWNSWYIHYDRVSQEHLVAAAEQMIASGMADAGYQYVNIDDCWMVKPGAPDSPDSSDPLLGGPARDASGAMLPNGKFPDLEGLVDSIHALGLKAGIYTSPGALTCAGYTGSLGHEAEDARRFAEWGFDFLKYDWCSYGSVARDQSRAELQKPYALMSEHLRRLDRDIVFNLCQYGMGEVWEWGAGAGGHCWRTTGDLGLGAADPFQAVLAVGLKNARLNEFAGPGRWNDPDYLLFGVVGSAFTMGAGGPTRMSAGEQYSTMSLWCLMAAPLIFSGDMTRLDPFTLNVLCNPEVIEIDQDPLGRQGRIVRHQDEVLLMVKELAGGSLAAGLFNLAPYERELGFTPAELGQSGTWHARDLWRQQDLGELNGEYRTRVGPHDVCLIRLWAHQGRQK